MINKGCDGLIAFLRTCRC